MWDMPDWMLVITGLSAGVLGGYLAVGVHELGRIRRVLEQIERNMRR